MRPSDEITLNVLFRCSIVVTSYYIMASVLSPVFVRERHTKKQNKQNTRLYTCLDQTRISPPRLICKRNSSHLHSLCADHNIIYKLALIYCRLFSLKLTAGYPRIFRLLNIKGRNKTDTSLCSFS